MVEFPFESYLKVRTKIKKDELKRREKDVTKREKQTKGMLEQQEILEKRLEECNRYLIVIN